MADELTQGEVEEQCQFAGSDFERTVRALCYTPKRDKAGQMIKDGEGQVLFVRSDKSTLDRATGALTRVLDSALFEMRNFVRNNDPDGHMLCGEVVVKVTLKGETRAAKFLVEQE